MIDWQLIARGRGPYDLAYFMSQSMDVSDRRSGERGIVERYHQTLIEHGVENYSIEQCWDDYRLAIMFCVTYPVAGGTMDAGNERGEALIRAMMTRSFTAVIDHNATELLEG